MSKMQQSLARLLAQKGQVTHGLLRVPRWRDVEAAGQVAAVEEIYYGLDGCCERAQQAVRGLWSLRASDLEFDGIAVELDEYLHFNQYRGQTLQSAVYRTLNGFPLKEYARYCVDHEMECLVAGGYGSKWTNPSSERQFGKGERAGNLRARGAPRWKQMAFYDFVKDLASLLYDIPLARIAWCDVIDEDGMKLSVAEALLFPSSFSADALARLVRERTVTHKNGI